MTDLDQNDRLNLQHDITIGSERSFGIVFSAFFSILALWPLIGGGDINTILAGIALVFLAISLIAPRVLSPLNKIWFRFGLFLGRIVTPITMGLLYITTVVPIGLIMQALGKDLLRLKTSEKAESYWIVRDPPGPEGESLKNQF